MDIRSIETAPKAKANKKKKLSAKDKKFLIEAMGGEDAIWMHHIEFRDTTGENVGRSETFFMKCADALEISDELNERYDGRLMVRIDNPYINSLEEIRRCYLDG